MVACLETRVAAELGATIISTYLAAEEGITGIYASQVMITRAENETPYIYLYL
jgi:hypothetical protein